MRRVDPRVALSLVASLSTAIALPTRRAHADPAESVTAPPLVPPSPRVRLSTALHRFEFGDYESVVAELESLVSPSHDGHALPIGDRVEALRAYGIACAVLGRTTAAEGAFLLLLEADPTASMDPALVRPEAVTLFEAVRARNSDTLRAAYQKGRGRRYAVLNLLPPAGQLQNHDYKKGYALLGVELALIALDVTSGSLLYSWSGKNEEVITHESAARVLRPVNWVSFGALISVALYGIIDGFVVGHRRKLEEKRTLERLSTDTRTTARTSKSTSSVSLALDGGVGIHF